jgi:hypothetical protein
MAQTVTADSERYETRLNMLCPSLQPLPTLRPTAMPRSPWPSSPELGRAGTTATDASAVMALGRRTRDIFATLIAGRALGLLECTFALRATQLFSPRINHLPHCACGMTDKVREPFADNPKFQTLYVPTGRQLELSRLVRH